MLPDPIDLHDFIGRSVAAREREWANVLIDEEGPDWEYLLALHLQLCELEHLLYRLKEMPL